MVRTFDSASHAFRFPPEPIEGVVVIRPPRAILAAHRAALVSLDG
jgi:hypothetical protein